MKIIKTQGDRTRLESFASAILSVPLSDNNNTAIERDKTKCDGTKFESFTSAILNVPLSDNSKMTTKTHKIKGNRTKVRIIYLCNFECPFVQYQITSKVQ